MNHRYPCYENNTDNPFLTSVLDQPDSNDFTDVALSFLSSKRRIRFTTSSYLGLANIPEELYLEQVCREGRTWSVNCRNHPLSSSSFSSENCSKTRSATVQVPLAAGRAPCGAAAQPDGRGVSEQLVSSDPSRPKHSTGHAINVRLGFCSSKQLLFRSLFGY